MPKVIPVIAESCESPGDIPKLNLPLTRREFLHGSGVLMGVIAASSPIALLAPSQVWALEMKSLTQAEGTAILKMARVLYPHKKLADAAYALVVKDLDGQAAGDAKAAEMMKAGVAALDKAAGGNFDKASDASKLAAVKSLEGQPFFNAVRGKCVTALYDNDMSFATFGYPGSAWEKGGYITRGFQDLKWLPAPPEAASPKPYMG